MATRSRDTRHADRVRAAICVALAARNGAALTISELVVAVQRRGVPLGPSPNKEIADAIRWEVGRGHVRKCGRGSYAVGRIPRSTLHYMAVRVARYAEDPTVSYSRPSTMPTLPGASETLQLASSLSKRMRDWDASRPRVLPPPPEPDPDE